MKVDMPLNKETKPILRPNSVKTFNRRNNPKLRILLTMKFFT